ncbi:hypothetical protein [Arenivirga flava]|uniref:DUF11 domain-containing protein n=1 Tax=Arenivirga flava TaxID=1930060 RepID=A0AA37XC13_9MICO|nr:hypothetical protein [Arenivirga flava]GMA29085.1 hypothetical protein GCM10025874_23380 [Arenivirga flava]
MSTHTGRKRAVLAGGTVLVAVGLATAAAFTDFATLNLGGGTAGGGIGGDTRFNMQVVGTDADGVPVPGTWQEASGAEGVDIVVPGADLITPGDTVRVSIPFRNESPALSADIAFSLQDRPGLTSDAGIAAALRYTVSLDGTALVTDATQAAVNEIGLAVYASGQGACSMSRSPCPTRDHPPRTTRCRARSRTCRPTSTRSPSSRETGAAGHRLAAPSARSSAHSHQRIQMIQRRTGCTRLVLSIGAVAATAGLVTAAAITDSDDVVVLLDGERNRFDLVAAASHRSDWHPGADDWEQGRPEAIRIPIGADGRLLGPGGVVSYRIAVRNVSPALAGAIELEIWDPQDRVGQLDPSTGRFVELFDQLRIVVRDGESVLVDRPPRDAPMRTGWDSPLGRDEHRVLDVELSLPAELDDRWQGASTDIAFRFTGVSV